MHLHDSLGGLRRRLPIPRQLSPAIFGCLAVDGVFQRGDRIVFRQIALDQLAIVDDTRALRVIPLDGYYRALLRPFDSGGLSKCAEAVELAAFYREAAPPKTIEPISLVRFDDEGSGAAAPAFGIVAELRTNLLP